MYEELETKLRAMLKGEFSSLTIGFNDRHACNYCDAKKFAEEYGEYEAGHDWISDEDRAIALAQNSVWSIQWYQDTPVGFYSKYASSLPKLLDYVFNEFPKE
jgi:DNA repair photolyase